MKKGDMFSFIKLRKKLKNNNQRGITLIAMIVTIIILLIIAGISARLLLSESGILNKATSAKEETDLASIKEELQLMVGDKIADLTSSGKKVTMDEIVNYLIGKVDSINSDGTNGLYKNYTFYIEPNSLKVIIGEKFTGELVPNIDEEILLDGTTYISTSIQESQILANSSFTIASRVYIDKNVQKTIQYMDILGNHTGASGFVWQFNTNTSNLNISPSGITIDYSPYYNKWTDIVMTYNNGKYTMYMDDQKIQENTTTAITPYSNLLIGTGFTGQDRAMRGMLSSVKLWTRELSETEVKSINMYNNISTIDSSRLLQLDFNDLAAVQTIGSISGTKYRFVENKNNIKYAFNFKGGTYLNTNIPESQIFSKGTFTIAARVFINRSEQQTVNYMDILGNHTGGSGLVWQFTTTTTQLGGVAAAFDYTPYYGTWTDIVMTYNNGDRKSYLNKVFKTQNTAVVSPYGNFLAGTGYTGENRAMKGKMESLRVWDVALDQNAINNMDLTTDNTLNSSNVILDLDFKDLSELQSKCTFAGGSFEYLLDE